MLDDCSASQPPSDERVEFHRGSVADIFAVQAAMRGADRVAHLATRNITVSEINPAAAFEVNAGGTLIVMREAARAKVKKVIYTSSVSVHDDLLMPITAHTAINPKTAYSIAKYAGELCRNVVGDLPLTILRLSNVYGPGQSDIANPYCGVVGHFMRASLEGRPLVVHGDGLSTRDYTYVDDAVEAIVASLVSDAAAPVDVSAFAVGTGIETSAVGLARMINEVTRRTLPIVHRPERSIDVVRRRVVDAGHFCAHCGWAPSVPLMHGLLRTWEWWRCQA